MFCNSVDKIQGQGKSDIFNKVGDRAVYGTDKPDDDK